MVFKGTISCASETVPQRPPAANGVRERSVIRVAAKKMAVITAMRSESSRSRVKGAHRKVHLN
jgi:hypothetical protein